MNLLKLFLGYVIGIYQPGTPGGPWSGEEARIVRKKVIEIINNTQEASSLRFREALQYGYDQRPDKGEASENSLIRLAFHDCVRYKDKSGGCDGCLNWKNINYEYKNIFDHQYIYDQIHAL